jgi:hypothetical protein
MHWSGSYDPSMAASLRDHLPLLGDLAGVQPTSLTPTDARYRFYRSHDHLRFARDRLTTRKIARTVERSVIDSWVPSSDPSSIRDRLTDLEYLISIRQGFLPFRSGDHIFIEPYSPHRCAHQLGLDQDIPAPLLRPEFLAADLEGVGWCYTHLFRLGTGVRCQMTSPSRVPTFSRRYQQWYHDAIRSYQSYTPPVVARITYPHDGHVSSSGDISYGRSLFPDIVVEPIDFQGLDSRFSRAPVRTTLTGTLHHPFRLFFPLVSFVPSQSILFLIQSWLMSTIMRSPGSPSLVHELSAFILSRLSSHRLQPPWGEIEITLLGRLPHLLFLLPFRVIFFTDLPIFIQARSIYSSD